MHRASLLGALAVCACASGPAGGSPGSDLDPGPAFDPLVEVRNDHWLPVQVYVLWSGTRYFLGEVAPDRRDVFRIPRSLIEAGGVRFMADPLGSAFETTTEPVELGTGRRFEWRIRKNLESSRVVVM